jgi:hypothetical protein
MRRTTTYVALDVHQATTVSSVRDETGRVIARTIIPTEAPALLAFVRSMGGAVHVVFEEGTQAQWLSELLTPATRGDDWGRSSRASELERGCGRQSQSVRFLGHFGRRGPRLTIGPPAEPE